MRILKISAIGIVIAAGAALLSACQSFDQAADSACYNHGYDPGTRSFSRCSDHVYDRMKYQQERDNEALRRAQERQWYDEDRRAYPPRYY